MLHHIQDGTVSLHMASNSSIVHNELLLASVNIDGSGRSKLSEDAIYRWVVREKLDVVLMQETGLVGEMEVLEVKGMEVICVNEQWGRGTAILASKDWIMRDDVVVYSTSVDDETPKSDGAECTRWRVIRVEFEMRRYCVVLNHVEHLIASASSKGLRDIVVMGDFNVRLYGIDENYRTCDKFRRYRC